MLLIVSLFFIAILFGLLALYLGFVAVRESPAYELRKRLRKLALRQDERLPADLSVAILKEMSPLDRMLYRTAPMRWLVKMIDNAGLRVDVKIYLIIIAIFIAMGFTVGVALGRGLVLMIILAIIFGVLPLVYLQINKDKRRDRFTEEFPAALDMIARSLRAGHSVSSAVQLVGVEMSEPIAGLFKAAHDEQTLGLTLKDALGNMAERMQSMDLRLFLAAMNIHRDVGGNMAETLERLAQTIRERIKIRRQIKVYTAQGRLTGYILAVLPVFMALFLFITSPDYLHELIEVKEGKYAIGFVVAGQVIGFLVIRKLINIKI